MSFYATYPGSGGGGISTYANLAAFPSAVTAGNGALAIALDTDILYISNGTVWEVLANPAHTGGDVVGPSSATDNAVTRFDGTTGKLIQNSGAILDDSNNLSGVAALTVTGTTTLATSLTGFLKATSGVVSSGLVSLTSNVTGVLPVANGGTNSSTALSNSHIMQSSGGKIVETAAMTIDGNGAVTIFPSADVAQLFLPQANNIGIGWSLYTANAGTISFVRAGVTYVQISQTTMSVPTNFFGTNAIFSGTFETLNIAIDAGGIIDMLFGTTISRFTNDGHLKFTSQNNVFEFVSGTVTCTNLLASGLVGIATTNPETFLQIGTPIAGTLMGNTPVARFIGSANSTSSQTILRLTRDLSSTQLFNAAVDFNVYSWNPTPGVSPYNPDTQLDIALKSTSTQTETADVTVMSLRSNGNVGIGTTAPTVPLHVIGATTITGTTTLATSLTGPLHAASGVVSASAISLTADVSGILPLANGGTGTNAASANAAFNALSPLTTKGDILGFSTVNARLAVGSNGQALLADSTQTLGIKWGAVLTNPMTTLGDIIYEDATPTPVRLAGNITSTKKFLTQTGTGSVSAVPGWNVIVAADLPAVTQGAAGAVASAGQLLGTNTNDNASAGNVGEYASVVGTWTPVTGSYVSTSAMSLTAGDWDVELIAISEGNAGASTTGIVIGISTDSTSNTFSDTDTTTSAYNTSFAPCVVTRGGGNLTIRKSLSTTTNIYGKAQATGASFSGTGPYFMRARRTR